MATRVFKRPLLGRKGRVTANVHHRRLKTGKDFIAIQVRHSVLSCFDSHLPSQLWIVSQAGDRLHKSGNVTRTRASSSSSKHAGQLGSVVGYDFHGVALTPVIEIAALTGLAPIV